MSYGQQAFRRVRVPSAQPTVNIMVFDGRRRAFAASAGQDSLTTCSSSTYRQPEARRMNEFRHRTAMPIGYARCRPHQRESPFRRELLDLSFSGCSTRSVQ